MRYRPNKDFTVFLAYTTNGGHRRPVATIHVNLLDARVHHFGKGKFHSIGCRVLERDGCTEADLVVIEKDIPKLKRRRLDFVLQQLDRFTLEAMMAVTGRTTQSDYATESLDLGDIKTADRRNYGATIKHRATVLGNCLQKKVYPKESERQSLKTCHSYLKDGYPPYSDDSFAYVRKK